MVERTLKEKTAKGLFWGGVSNGVQQLLSVLIGVVLLKNLSPGDYGMIGMLAIFIGIANTIQESGFTTALINREKIDLKDYNAVFWFNVMVGIVIYIILFLFAPIIADFYKHSELIPLSRILFLSILIGSLGIAHNALLFKNIQVKERAKIDIISIITSGGCGILLAINGYGYWALAFQTLISASCGTFLRWYYSNWKPDFSFSISPIKEMFGFSFKMLLSVLISQINGNLFSVLFGKFYTKSDVGYFSQGAKWSLMGGQLVSGMVTSVAQPVFIGAREDKIYQVRIFYKILRFISFVSFPLLLGLAFVGRDFIEILNEEWLPCVPILQMYCVWASVSPINLLYTQLIISKGHSDYIFWCNLFYGVSLIILALFILSYGIYWLVFMHVIVSFLFLFIWHYLAKKILPISSGQVLRDIMPFFLISLFVFCITWFCVWSVEDIYIRLVLKILISIGLYILIMSRSKSVIFKESFKFLVDKLFKIWK